MRVFVLGGGAAGLSAAVSAARKGAKVAIFEREGRVGGKILATGGGRCNLSNTDISVAHYHGSGSYYFRRIYEEFDAREFFASLGVLTRVEDGRIYPATNMASTVLDALRYECEMLNVRVKSQPPEGRYDSLIVATGGMAGGGGVPYAFLQSVGHTVIEPTQALVPLRVALNHPKGVRVRARVSMGGRSEIGEVQFGDGYISGIPVMNMSRAAVGQTMSLDFFPEIPKEELCTLIEQAKKRHEHADRLLTGLMNPQLGYMLLRMSGVRKMTTYTEDVDAHALADVMKDCAFKVLDKAPWSAAQVTAGGVNSVEFDAVTLRSLRRKRLFAAGEALDIDGDCGGYNLHWAWASGVRAGEAAAGCWK